MAVFQVYCDESGHLADTECVSFGACIFAQDEIATFVQKWNGLCANAGVRYITMKEAMSFAGEFKGWRDRAGERDSLLEAACDLFQDRCVFHTNSTMGSKEFKALSEDRKKKLRNLPYAGFEALVKGISDTAKKNPANRFHLIYDLSEAYSTECLKMFNRLRMMHGVYRQFFTALTFADDCDFPPLQVADMLAYVHRLEYIAGGIDKCEGITKRLLEIINRDGNGGLRKKDLIYGEDAGLGDGVIGLPIQ